MIDIHSHILPGVDDGARNMFETSELLHTAVESDVKAIVATPHCNIPGHFDNYLGQWYIEKVQKVKELVKQEQLPIQVLPGMEVYATENLPRLLAEKKVMTLNGGRFLLMEFDFDEDPEFAFQILQKMWDMKVCPVIAHAERYRFVQENPWIAYEWREAGYLVQVNKGSFQGRFGRHAQRTAFQLMDHGLVSVIASDAHSPHHRTTYMIEAYEELAEYYPQEVLDVLFHKNPRRICNNDAIIQLPMIPFEER